MAIDGHKVTFGPILRLGAILRMTLMSFGLIFGVVVIGHFMSLFRYDCIGLSFLIPSLGQSIQKIISQQRQQQSPPTFFDQPTTLRHKLVCPHLLSLYHGKEITKAGQEEETHQQACAAFKATTASRI